MFILDTDTLTHFFQGQQVVVSRVREKNVTGQLATSIVTRIQILQGRFDFALKASTASELMRARQLLQKSDHDLTLTSVVDFNEAAAVEFERLRTVKALRKIGRADLLIACITLAHKATLVTRNLKDFKLIPGLKCENWAD